MNGIINVYKEKNMSSHAVVGKIRHILNTKQVGHLGTLDPLAEGVLVVLVGGATKLAPYLEDDHKTYEAEVILGFSTTTYDLEGEEVARDDASEVTQKEIDDVLKSFLGTQQQMPPIYSAIKINGKKLYEYARKNQSIDIPPRNITIYSIERSSEIYHVQKMIKFKITAKVSRGTYMRSLCFDIGEKLKVPSCMGYLKRLESGDFKLADSVKLEDITLENPHLLNPLDFLKKYFVYECGDNVELCHKITNGMKISLKTFNERHSIVIFSKNNVVLAVYQLVESEKPYYQAVRVWK